LLGIHLGGIIFEPHLIKSLVTLQQRYVDGAQVALGDSPLLKGVQQGLEVLSTFSGVLSTFPHTRATGCAVQTAKFGTMAATLTY